MFFYILFFSLFIVASNGQTATAKPFSRITISSPLDSNSVQSKCLNSCLNNFSDIMKCKSSRIVLEEISNLEEPKNKSGD